MSITQTGQRGRTIVEDGKWAGGESVAVRFTGGRARCGPITVGQANMRRCVLEDEPTSINARIVCPAPPDATLGRVAELVTVMILRHEGLRTTFPDEPGTTQSVAGSGELTMAVHESAGDPEWHAWEVAQQMRASRFDPATELPLRVAVIVADGAPAWMVFVMSHLAVDTLCQNLFRSEWALLAEGRELPPPASMQPVDLGEWEQSPEGRRRITVPLRYWEDLLGTAPQAMFAAPGVGPMDWTLPRMEVRSRAAAPALARVVARTGASPGAVVLAAMCALIGYRLGVRKCLVAIVAVNRFLPELADYFGTIAQDALMATEMDAATFDELIGRVKDRSLAAYRRSYFDPVELWKIIDRVGQQRGTHWARDCIFSDPTGLTAAGLVSAPAYDSGTDIDGTGADDIQISWEESAWVPSRLMLTADRLDGEVALSMWAEPQCLPAPEAEEFASALVRLIIEAGRRDVSLAELSSLARFHPVARGAGWYLIDSCWVELAAVRGLVSDVLGGSPCLVVPVPDAAVGHRLECYAAAGSDPPSPERLHADCLAALPMLPNAMAPHRYVLCAQAPSDPDDAGAWQAQPRIAGGSGRLLAAPVAAAAS